MRNLLFGLVLFLACNDPAANYVKTQKQEKGFVVAMQYAAPVDGSGSTTTVNSGGGVGFGSTSIHTEEKYMVVFRCEHGVVFSIDEQNLYTKLDERDSVYIDYYEYSLNGTIKELDFIDANPIKK